MLENSSNIFSKTKHLWDDIQKSLKDNTDDNTPFALLPVRLETRFMKVKRKFYPYLTTEESVKSVDAISFATDKFISISASRYPKAQMEIDAYGPVSKQLQNAVKYIESDSRVYTNETKSTFHASLNFLMPKVEEKLSQVKELREFTAEDKNRFVDNLNQLLVQCETILSAVNRKKTSREKQEFVGLNSNWWAPNYFNSKLIESQTKWMIYKEVPELWVRIYPDDIHIHSHENPLTLAEIQAGIDYWNIWWASDGDMDKRRGAWKGICEFYGPQRAAWIIKQMRPANLPNEPLEDDSVIFYTSNVIQNTAAALQNTLNSNFYQAGSFSAALKTVENAVADFTSYISQAKMGKGTQEEMLLSLGEFDGDVEQLQRMIDDAQKSEVRIEEKELKRVDVGEQFKGLISKLIELRDPNPELKFDFKEWEQQVYEHMSAAEKLIDQVEHNQFDEKSLKEASEIGGQVLGLIAENERLLTGIKEGAEPDKNDKEGSYEVFMRRIEGGELFEPLMRTMEQPKMLIRKFNDSVLKATVALKSWQIQMNIKDFDYVYFIKETFGQIKKNVEDVKEVDPWDPFNFINSSVDTDGNFIDPPVFPNPPVKEESWEEAPMTYVLPDRFVAIGIDDKAVSTNNNSSEYGKADYNVIQYEVGGLIPGELQVGIGPDDETAHNTNGEIEFSEELSWLTDFSSAVENGMGIVMEVKEGFTPGQTNNVFDKLVVLGVKSEKERFHKPDESKDYSSVDLKDYSKELLEELLINHHYKEEGMGIMKVGSATNNTENSDSNWKPDETHYEDSFAFETLNNLFPIRSSYLEQSNGQRLAEALGVNYNIFQHIENADSTDISDAFKFNRMLWHGTAGNYFKEMLSGLVTRENYNQVKSYFDKYVSARGYLPTLRVGSQPYGILPVSSHSKWDFGVNVDEGYNKVYKNANTLHFSNGQSSYDYYDMNKWGHSSQKTKRFDQGFKSLLDLMINRFYGLFNEPNLVKHVGNVQSTDEFMKILALQASSVELQLRYPYSIADLFSGDNLTFANHFGSVPFSSFFGLGYMGNEWVDLVKQGVYPTQSMAFSEDNIVNHIQYLNSKFDIYKNPIDKYKLSENQMINRTDDNYLEWIRTADLRHIWNPSDASDYPFKKSISPLMFKMLRQSYLMMHLDAFVDVSVKSGLLDENYYHYLSGKGKGGSSLISVFSGTVGTISHRYSKWAFLFEKLSNFASASGDEAHLADYKEALDLYLSTKNYNLGYNTTIAQHVQSYYSNFWKLRGGYLNRNKIAFLDKIYREVRTWSTAHLDRLFREHLDLCSYRLDAWADGFVNRRLDRTRTTFVNNKYQLTLKGYRKREQGIYLGAYGWVENVKPGGNRTEATELPASLEVANKKVFTDDDNLGYIHGPSLYHAMTAAILRSGYVSNQDVDDNQFAVSLTSERVRMAKMLWEGIKNGQSLGALLGYQLERNLHESYPDAELDAYIFKLRKKYPIEDYHTELPNANSSEQIPAQNVVNGVNLLGDVRMAMDAVSYSGTIHQYLTSNIHSTATSPTYDFQLNVPNSTARGILVREIDLMANAIDALGDLAIAEGVFQLSKGNFKKTSTSIDDLLENSNMPLPEILDTPRTGNQVHHRLCVNIKDDGSNPWTSISLTERAMAAPHINNYIAKYLPAPENIKVLVSYKNINGGQEHALVSAVDLGWQPIDCYEEIMSGLSQNKSEELIGRIASYARKNLDYDPSVSGSTLYIPIEEEVSLSFNNRELPSPWAANVYTFAELLPILENLSEVLAEIKPLKAQDFKLPQDTSIDDDFGWDLSELDSRIRTGVNHLNTLINSVSIGSTQTVSDYETAIDSSQEYGTSFAYSASIIDTELQAVWEDKIRPQLQQLEHGVSGIIGASGAELFNSATVKTDIKWKQYLKAGQLLFGAHFVYLPKLKLNTDIDASDSNTLLLKNHLKDYITNSISGLSDTKQDKILSTLSTNDFSTWFYGLSRLRKKIGALETISDFDEVNTLDFSPMQFPFSTYEEDGNTIYDYWFGWEFPDSYKPTGNKTSVIMTDRTRFANSVNSTSASPIMVGFTLDEWSETIPEKEETTGIAFNYNNPNTKAPQNVLLAVTPEFKGYWDGNNILHTLLDTIKMSKVRLVEPEHLHQDEFLSKYLPMMYSFIELPENTIDRYVFKQDYLEATKVID